MSRTSRRMPWRIVGIGSETVVTWAVSGSIRRAFRTTTLPRSKGPATAGVTTARRERGAFVGAGEVGVAGGMRRGSGPAPAPARTVPTWLAAGQAGAGDLGGAGALGAGDRGQGGLGAVGDALEVGDQARGRGDAEAGEAPGAVVAGRRRVKGDFPRLGVLWAGGELGFEAAAAALGDLEVRADHAGGVARPGGERGLGCVGAAGRGGAQGGARAAEELDVDLGERRLGRFVEAGGDLAVGAEGDLAGLLDADTRAFGDQVHRQQGAEGVLGLLGQIDRAGQRLGQRPPGFVGDRVALGVVAPQQRRLDFDRADLGGIGAGDWAF